jgi:TonB family protein
MNLQADPAQRLTTSPKERALEERALAPRRRRFAPLALSLLVHAGVLALLLYEPALLLDTAPREEETAVEVVVEPPPQPQPEEQPPEPEPEPEQQPKPKEKPPQQQIVDDEKPAFDAPRAPNNETVDREAPDQETKAERAAPPDRQVAAKPSPDKNPDPERQAATQSPPEAAAEKVDEDKPDAEVVEKAEPKQEARLEEEQGQVEVKASPEPKKLKSISDQIASLAPLPDYKVAGSSKPAPVSGGTAKTTYLSILFGMIMRHMHIPPEVRGKKAPNHGIVAFYVDERGNLVHQAVYRSSGFGSLDAAALAAVRRAAPFPPPPSGHSHGIQFHFSPK